MVCDAEISKVATRRENYVAVVVHSASVQMCENEKEACGARGHVDIDLLDVVREILE